MAFFIVLSRRAFATNGRLTITNLRPASALKFRIIMFSLNNKAAIVTGGASGIGLAIARQFINAGARVLIADRRADGVDAAKSAGAEFCKTDVSEEAGVAGMFRAATECFGRVDVLVNNAGIQPLGVRFQSLTAELLRRTFDVNVNGVALGLKYAMSSLSEGGRVINIASFVGLIGTPGSTAYSASKAAVIHLTKPAPSNSRRVASRSTPSVPERY